MCGLLCFMFKPFGFSSQFVFYPQTFSFSMSGLLCFMLKSFGLSYLFGFNF